MSLIRRVARAVTQRSPRTLLDRAAQLGRARLEYHGLGDPSEARPTELLRLLRRQGITDADALLERFRNRVRTESFPAFRDRSRTVRVINERWPNLAALVEGRAERVAAGRFELLGYDDLSFGSPIDWALDPIAGLRAPTEHWSRVPYLEPAKVGDHKVVWELNRHQYLIHLCRAAWLNDDERWARECFAHLDAWMAANPPKVGINWTSSLEVAFRSISWLWVLHFLCESEELSASRFLRIVAHLRAHGRHVEKYISTSFSPNTHLTGEALGLFYLGTLLPELPEAERWRKKGQEWLMGAFEFQILHDGGYFEQSLHYHRYTVDFIIHLLWLSRLTGNQVPQGLEARLTQTVDHLIRTTRADGTSPLIGDDDGGKLLFLDDRPVDDVRATLLAAAVLMERKDWAAAGGEPSGDLVWLIGPDALERLADLEGGSVSRTSAPHAQTGLFVIRSGPPEAEDFALIRCGPPAGLSGGHSHADALAIDLTLDGRPLLVDPGTGLYMDPKHREWFRSTAAHNTVTVRGASSSEAHGPFGWSQRPTGLVESWMTAPTVSFFSGSHNGFERLDPGLVHRRSVMHVHGEYWLIRDRVTSAIPNQVRAHFQFAVGTDVTRTDESSLIVRRDGSPVAVLSSLSPTAWTEGDGHVAPVYGRIVPAPAWAAQPVGATADGALGAELITLVARPGTTVTRVQEDRQIWRIGERGDVLAVGGASTSDSGAAGPRIATDFEWLWARPNESGGWNTMLAVDGSRLSLGAETLELSAPARHLYGDRSSGTITAAAADQGTRDDLVNQFEVWLEALP